MNEIAKTLWDTSVAWLEHANESDDVNTTIAYTGLAEIALQQAQFAVNNPDLVLGQDSVPMPDGDVMPAGVPPYGPTQGPRFWGAPQQ